MWLRSLSAGHAGSCSAGGPSPAESPEVEAGEAGLNRLGVAGLRTTAEALLPEPVMNGPADGEVDYKKKYRNLKRKLKFLIYVSAGVGRWGGGGAAVRPGAGRSSVYLCVKGAG